MLTIQQNRLNLRSESTVPQSHPNLVCFMKNNLAKWLDANAKCKLLLIPWMEMTDDRHRSFTEFSQILQGRFLYSLTNTNQKKHWNHGLINAVHIWMWYKAVPISFVLCRNSFRKPDLDCFFSFITSEVITTKSITASGLCLLEQ